jgi:hypothetical protein
LTNSSIAKTTARKLNTVYVSRNILPETQRKALAAAARNAAGAAVIPENMNKRAADKLGASLIEKGLVREIKAKPGLSVWRTADDGRTYALIITKAGRDAIQGAAESEPDDASVGPKNLMPDEVAQAEAHGVADIAPMAAIPVSDPPRARFEPSAPREGSKLAKVIALVSRAEGAGIDDLISATGWLPHTTRAALTGLRKRGFVIQRTQDGQRRTLYRIVDQEEVLNAA